MLKRGDRKWCTILANKTKQFFDAFQRKKFVSESRFVSLLEFAFRRAFDVFCSYVNRTLLFVTIFFSEIKHFFQVSRGRKGPKSLEHHAFAKNFILLSLLVEMKDRIHVVTFTYRE